MLAKLLAVLIAASTLGPAGASPALPALVRAARAGTPIALEVGALGRVELLLNELDLLVPGAPITLDGRPFDHEPFWTLAGTIAGVPDSDVRLTVTADDVAGSIRAGARTEWLDPWAPPHAASSGSADRLAVVDAPFNHGPVGVNAGIANCAVQECGTLTAYVMLDADESFTAEDPETCPARQIATLTAVAAIYDDAATDIDLRAAGANCSSASHGSAFDEALLISLTNTWRGVGPSRSTLLHVVGSDLTGSAIGIAYQPGVCARPEPSLFPQRCEYGIAAYQSAASGGSYTGSLSHRAKLTAHELGHNFNGEHDDAASCETASGTLLCPSFKPAGPDAFSDANAARIRGWAESTIGWAVCAMGSEGEPLSGC